METTRFKTDLATRCNLAHPQRRRRRNTGDQLPNQYSAHCRRHNTTTQLNHRHEEEEENQAEQEEETQKASRQETQEEPAHRDGAHSYPS